MIYLLILLQLGLLGGTSSVYDSQKHGLGDNLIINSGFDQPDMGASLGIAAYGNDIPGWHCPVECQLIDTK